MIRLLSEWNDLLTRSISSTAVKFYLVLFDDNEIRFAGNGVSMVILWERLILPILCSRVADFMLFS